MWTPAIGCPKWHYQQSLPVSDFLVIYDSNHRIGSLVVSPAVLNAGMRRGVVAGGDPEPARTWLGLASSQRIDVDVNVRSQQELARRATAAQAFSQSMQ